MLIALIISVASSLNFTEISIGEMSKSIEVPKGCSVFHLGANYHRLSLHFSAPTDHLTSIRWTDILTETCDRTKCPTDSTVCGEVQSFKAVQTVVGTCISDLYLYVKSSDKSSFAISTQYEEGECDKIVENLYTQCGSMNYAECDKCDDECRLANCIATERYNSPEKILMNLCLPFGAGDQEVEDRCVQYKGVDKGVWKQDCDNSIDVGSVGAGTVVVLVVIMMAFFGFVGIVTWYNWKLKAEGTPPIKCLRCCPDVLFPRPKLQPPPSYYRPPDVSLQTFK